MQVWHAYELSGLVATYTIVTRVSAAVATIARQSFLEDCHHLLLLVQSLTPCYPLLRRWTYCLYLILNCLLSSPDLIPSNHPLIRVVYVRNPVSEYINQRGGTD